MPFPLEFGKALSGCVADCLFLREGGGNLGSLVGFELWQNSLCVLVAI